VNARPGLRRILLDTLSWGGGWVIILKQAGILFVPPPQVNETLIWLAAALIGVPGLTQILALRFGGSTPTAGSPPVPPPPASLPSSPGAASGVVE
jgi:hypothetical protein